ncbi:hypothetical protein SPRG_19621, partial [Saprolegnia parasitica CBS 223.65]
AVAAPRRERYARIRCPYPSSSSSSRTPRTRVGAALAAAAHGPAHKDGAEYEHRVSLAGTPESLVYVACVLLQICCIKRHILHHISISMMMRSYMNYLQRASWRRQAF